MGNLIIINTGTKASEQSCDNIDLVVLYSNGSNPYLRNTQLNLGIKLDRFRENELFCVFMTSWEKLRFRKIFVVLNDFDFVLCPNQQNWVLIKHSMIMPRLTFNSFYMEWHIWRIPGLSNWFMYTHDDMVPTKYNKEVCNKIFYTNHHVYTATNVLSIASLHSMQMVFDDLICPEVLNGYDHGPQLMNKLILQHLAMNYKKEISSMKIMRSKKDFVFQDVYSVYIRCKTDYHISNSAIPDRQWDSRVLYITYRNWDSDKLNNHKSWYYCVNDDGYTTHRSQKIMSVIIEKLL